MKRLSVFIILSVFLIAARGALLTTVVNAQDDGGATVTITGTFTGTSADGAIIVDGTTYHLANGVSLPPGTVVGAKITITGKVSSNTQIIIITVIHLVDSTPTPAPTDAATSAATPAATMAPTGTNVVNGPGIIIIIEGPVRDIHANQILIYDFNVQIAPDDPMLTIIKIGDRLHIKGNLDKSGVLIALEVSNAIARRSGGTALVEGHIQAINGNMLTINGVNVQLAPDDPRLKTFRVGNFLSVNGNFERHGTTIVLIVINIIVINDADIDLFLYCRAHPGMGMGADGMGMGMAAPPPPGMGMGMGDDGMGMGVGTDECRWP